MSHTPGPWQTTDIVSDGTLVYRRIEAAKRHIGCVYLKDNAEADARLIAAAPDLLAALQTIADGTVMTPGKPYRAVDVMLAYQDVARLALAKVQS